MNKIKDAVFAKTGGKCFYCGSPAEQVDHFIPRLEGGPDDIGNLVPACKWCNKSKRGYSLEVWRRKMALSEGYCFTENQRAVWGWQLPDDRSYPFYFELMGIKP